MEGVRSDTRAGQAEAASLRSGSLDEVPVVGHDELGYVTANELAARIRRGELSPVEVLASTIARIEARNESLNAFVYLGFEEARERAQWAEREIASGGDLGPLHGVPVAMKDLFDFKPGWPTTFGGIRALAGFVPDFHCAYSERMERAGAIMVGKTNAPVMGFRGTCDNYLFGPSRNPFDPAKNTGGSSGGSAAAVAAGMVPIAEGTDGGGSIRIPAAWCNLYGFKASYGRVPFLARPNAFGSTAPFLTEGALTRTVEDAALALNVLAGYHPADPFSIDGASDFTGAIRRSIKGMRIAYSPGLDVYPVDGRIAAAVEAAVAGFEHEGAHVERVELGIEYDQRELSDLWCRLILPVMMGAFESFKAAGVDLLSDHREDLPPRLVEWMERGYRMSAVDVARDQAMRTRVYDAIQTVMADYDAIVSPTLACMPVDNADDGDTAGPTSINGVEVDPLIGWCLTYFANFTGQPAASVPAGLIDVGGSNPLPVGMQIMGRRYADADVLALSAAFERLRPWQDAYQLL